MHRDLLHPGWPGSGLCPRRIRLRVVLKAKIDLNLGVNADAVTAYVAMSRFKTASDLIILQPFDLQTFQQGGLGS